MVLRYFSLKELVTHLFAFTVYFCTSIIFN